MNLLCFTSIHCSFSVTHLLSFLHIFPLLLQFPLIHLLICHCLLWSAHSLGPGPLSMYEDSFPHLVYTSTLKMEAVQSPKISVKIYQIAWNRIPIIFIVTIIRTSNLTKYVACHIKLINKAC